ncbi:MAG: YqgE/AlgH family protein [Alphaproteobacteria bacterium]|nr:YqgE/AlgH family protein [Alphaproteobacteria bacterium]
MTRNKNAYLTGKLLLAMPSMSDPRFHKAVIFICVHDEQGAMGLVVNHDLPHLSFDGLLDQLGIASDIHVNVSLPVMSGGPVESARGFMLHTNDFNQKDTIKIDERFSVTGTLDALADVAAGKGPENMLFILGYAGWSAGQLDQEIQDNAWLVVDPDPEIIFAKDPEIKWEKAVSTLGFDPVMLSGDAGHA